MWMGFRAATRWRQTCQPAHCKILVRALLRQRGEIIRDFVDGQLRTSLLTKGVGATGCATEKRAESAGPTPPMDKLSWVVGICHFVERQ